MINQEDSYVERRHLFKNIWDTAMQIDKDADYFNKHKVIKTLRLDEEDKSVISRKRKKERLRNLRVVCNKILDFCDRQDADDKFYEHSKTEQAIMKECMEMKSNKTKILRKKRKVRRAKSLFTPTNTDINKNQVKLITMELKNDTSALQQNLGRSSGDIPGPLVAKFISVKDNLNDRKPNNSNQISQNDRELSFLKTTSSPRRKTVRKKVIKSKKNPDQVFLPTGASNHRASRNMKSINATVRGRAVLRRVKQLLAINKISIACPVVDPVLST